MTRCFLRVLVLAAATILGLALSPTAVAAEIPTAISTEAYTYDASVYEGVLAYTAPERGPPTQAEKPLVSAGHNAVLHWSHGTLARSHGSATAVTLDYDDRLQFAQVAHGGTSNPERLGAATGAPFSLPDSKDAAKNADEFVDLASSSRRTHILDGDATGGGHLWPGLAGKTPFPKDWSGNRVMHEISDVATDPSSVRARTTRGRRSRHQLPRRRLSVARRFGAPRAGSIQRDHHLRRPLHFRAGRACYGYDPATRSAGRR